MRRGGVVLLMLAGTSPLAAQAAARQSASGGCRFQLDHVGGVGQQIVVGADTNYYANGGVRLVCADSSARIASDSVALYGRGGSSIVNFVGHVRYEDSITVQTADRGTYFRNGDRWEARGQVETRNLRDGSTIRGPALDYFRPLPGVRDTLELYATGRPVIESYPRDSGATRPEPYRIVAERVRMKGRDRTWAGGQVTIDRSDFAARGDSLFLDSGDGSEGRLMGSPVLRGLGRDSFEIRGTRIDLTLDHQVITYVKALGEGHAISRDLDLVADTIGLDLDQQKLVQTIAWGTGKRPHAVTSENEIRADSVAFDTPGQELREIRAFRQAWVGGKSDSLSGERDWMAGDTVVAGFISEDSAGVRHSVLSQLTASGTARSFYRVAERTRGDRPSINYSRGDHISVAMKTGGRRGVDRVKIDGHVDGLHLEPLPPGADTTGTAPARHGPGR
jgi:hypothetical protein